MLDAMMSSHAMWKPRQTLISPFLTYKIDKRKNLVKVKQKKTCVIKTEKRKTGPKRASGYYRCVSAEKDSGLWQFYHLQH